MRFNLTGAVNTDGVHLLTVLCSRFPRPGARTAHHKVLPCVLPNFEAVVAGIGHLAEDWVSVFDLLTPRLSLPAESDALATQAPGLRQCRWIPMKLRKKIASQSEV